MKLISQEQSLQKFINSFCDTIYGQFAQALIYIIPAIFGVVTLIWQYIIIAMCFTFPIIIFLLSINFKLRQILSIKGKLIFRGCNFHFDSSKDGYINMNLKISVFNCSYSTIYFKIIEGTSVIIKEKVANLDKVREQLKDLNGMILPFQEIDINLPIIENIQNDELLKSSAKIICEYGDYEGHLANRVEWQLENIELLKINNSYHKIASKLTNVHYYDKR